MSVEGLSKESLQQSVANLSGWLDDCQASVTNDIIFSDDHTYLMQLALQYKVSNSWDGNC